VQKNRFIGQELLFFKELGLNKWLAIHRTPVYQYTKKLVEGPQKLLQAKCPLAAETMV
jgi:hypothetical protein